MVQDRGIFTMVDQ